MKPLIAVAAGATLSVLAFPPFGPGVLVVPGVTLFLIAIRLCSSRRGGFWAGALYGLMFFGGVMWWLAELELLALILIPVQALFFAVFGWWLVRHNGTTPGVWLVLTVGGWAVMELIRYHAPVGGLEWGAAGYALSDSFATRFPAATIGTSGLTVLVVLLSALLAQTLSGGGGRGTLWGGGVLALVVGVSLVLTSNQVVDGGSSMSVAVVQGSTPCPFEHCPPNERLRTYEQHLALTENIEPGTADLVIWPEGSTGSTNADPILNDEIARSIGDQARRLDSPMVVGGDRVISDDEWVNANVYFDPAGNVVGEYRKQHPVPFGEYIPLRPLFEWIPALRRVPRDMVRGDGPVLMGPVGSVISFEGGFSRYPLETRRAGAEVIVVNTNEASYGPDAPTSDQFIGMTRMRAVELGVPVIHAAVTGKSVVIDLEGNLGPVTDLGAMEILEDDYQALTVDTPYTVTGDLVVYLAAVLGIITWSSALVGSVGVPTEED